MRQQNVGNRVNQSAQANRNKLKNVKAVVVQLTEDMVEKIFA
ncbi:hypothetical protein [Anoxybacteroides tepidamans]|nr:hypothetical protein [Anoxybacillus tepidamans]